MAAHLACSRHNPEELPLHTSQVFLLVHGMLFRYVFLAPLSLFGEEMREWRWDIIGTSFGER